MRVPKFILASGLSVLAVMLTVANAEAQVRDYGVIMGDAGEQRVALYGAFNRQTCQTIGSNLMPQATHARLELRFAESKSAFKDDHPACAGRPLNQTALFAKPQPGLRGLIRFRLLETGLPTGPLEREVVIYVRDPAKPDTPPPTKADVDHVYGPVMTMAKYDEYLKTLPQQKKKAAALPASPAQPARTVSNQANQQMPEASAYGVPLDASNVFRTKARIGGFEVDAVIDTGASVVAIPFSLAQQLKINGQQHAVKVPVKTANGEVTATITQLSAISVGPFTEREVMTAILPEGVDAPVLIGMTFLSRFRSVQVANRMILLMR